MARNDKATIMMGSGASMPSILRYVACLAVGCIVLSLSPACAVDRPDAAVIPEYFLLNPTKNCYVEVGLLAKALPERKNGMLKFLHAGYAATKKWSSGYSAFDVDYLTFSRFSIVEYGKCQPLTAVGKLLDDSFGRRNWHWKKVQPGSLISSREPLRKLRSISEVFYHFRPRTDLQDCLVALKLRPGVPLSDGLSIFRTLVASWQEYRLPFLNVGESNSTFFLLFSRYCPERKAIAQIYLGLLSEGDSNLPAKFFPPDDRSGAAEYLGTMAP